MTIINFYNYWLGPEKNTYLEFIDECQNKKIPDGIEVQIHHIVPKHWVNSKKKELTLTSFSEHLNFLESKENLIRLSIDDHIKAHQLLYEIYQKPLDKAAFDLLQGNKSESRKIWRQEGAKGTHQKLSAEKRNFWDPKFQKKMAQQSLAKSDALEVRSKGGRIGGRNRNLNRVITKQDKFLFFFQEKPVLCCFSCETGGDVLKILNSFKQTPLQRVTPLLKGEKKSLHGWSCKKIN